MEILYMLLSLIGYILLTIFIWKSFDFFNMSFWSHSTMTGWQYFSKKLGSAIVLPPVIVIMVLAFFDVLNKDDKKLFTKEVQKSLSITSPVVNMPDSKYLNPKDSEELIKNKSQDIKVPEAQYEGDDPIIRERLGLPLKN